jgi:hypothetical protein
MLRKTALFFLINPAFLGALCISVVKIPHRISLQMI